MAKKIKPNALLQTASSLEDEANAAEANCNGIAQNTTTEILTDDAKEKLWAYEKLEEENARLSQENAEMTDKLAEYIEENEKLKAKSKESKTSTASNSQIKKLNDEISMLKADLEKFKSKVQNLQDENDSYLMRISELSFENAKLASEKQNANTASKPEVPQYSHFQQRMSRKDRNGYESWN